MKNPHPSAPHRLARHVLYADREDGRRLVVAWVETYAAHHWLQELIGAEKVTRLALDTIALGDGDIEVRCEELREVMEYKPCGDERDWVLPTPFVEGITRFCGERRQRKRVETALRVPKRPQRAAGDAYVTIAQLASELGMTPREARARLRQAKVSKPQHGRWEWPSDEAKRIAKIIG